MKISQFSTLLFFIAMGCSNGPSESRSLSDCPHPAPVPIFNDDLAAVTNHRFQLNDLEGIEEVDFANGMRLTLIQSGCETIRQEFQFRIPGSDFPSDDTEYWVEEALRQLRYLAGLGPQYLSLNDWAQAIEMNKELFQLGEPTEIQVGFRAEIDRIRYADHATVLLILSQ
jgi:hypothetical protein